jgi:hypothetical protein
MKRQIKKIRFILSTFMMLLVLGFGSINAQPASTISDDTLTSVLEKLRSDVGLMNRLKITGYVQAQWQMAQQQGIPSFAGGNFPANVDNRFSVRRGRIKFSYENNWSQYVLQIDATQGGVVIKDAYVNFTDPWLKYFTLQGGIFNRPFGFEIAYSSSSRETPERARITQTLFPGERDLGAMLSIGPPKTSRFYGIKLDAGLFNGIGPTANDFDKYKDFIGHLYITKSNRSETFKYGAGVSYYYGGWAQGTKYDYKMSDVTSGDQTIKAFVVDSTKNIGAQLKRQYLGFDAQLAFDFPFGITQLRGEYIFGTQPATSGSSVSLTAVPTSNPAVPYSTTAIVDTAGNITGYKTVANSAVNSDAYIRKFNGYYVYLVQDIGHSKHQLVLKYDYYDPNTDIKGNDIAKKLATMPKWTKTTNSTDLAYNTFGIGWNYRWNANVKIMAYYEFVKNETSSNLSSPDPLKDFSKDMKDNVFTLRVQFKF